SAVAALAGGLVAAGVVVAVLPQIGEYQRAEIDRRVGLHAQDELFTALDRLAGLARFESPAFLNRLLMAQHCASSPGSLVECLFTLVGSAVMLVGFVGSLAAVSPLITAVVALAAVPALLVELRLSRHRAAMMWRIGPTERRELFFGELQSTPDAAVEVRLFGLGAFLRGRMNAQTCAANAARRRMDRDELRYQGGLALLSALVAGGGLVWAVAVARAGLLTVGDVSMFVIAVAGVQSALGDLVVQTAKAHHLLTLFGHYTAVVEGPPDLPLPTRARPVGPLRHGIELRDVWFRYGEDHPWVLRGVNLFIPHGRTVGLVGLNGAGKTTLIKLLCRFYDPVRGSVLWDGTDIRDVPVAELRARIGAVFQDFFTYDLTASENIAVGDLPALHEAERITDAAALAGVHHALAALPRGYDTLLSRTYADDADDTEDGVLLSGGQWQRLALARGFLRRDRDLMILDEPSAGLDAAAEHEIHLRLRGIRDGRTSILISHRLGTLREAELIVVISEGVVAEEGDHHQLMRAGGEYARLFTLQAAGYERDTPPLLGSGSREPG
ncbi:MAG: ABC transporter ATP-binding protein, partial [Pseudonocardia sp.]